ncbi:PREDICTED: probable disease resistance protein At5g66910 [Populus euphratica]|uniref:Probable disease resistance protein At5g66910 n=1 Tax=Populus euphratica TaxID=75702 RepID=A0AAJ6V0B8_POPEU|nr:PREDICTED: probable disease resistance protein At5g66910 [Populus euphratica]XP_011039226.1 PREDICTED: probable disease resistance protein At5g66910 [Populus euphratica]
MEPISQLVSGAALGVALQLLSDSIMCAVTTASSFKFKLRLLQTTVGILIARFKVIRGEQQQFPGAEAQRLCELLARGCHLVSKCSRISQWNYFKMRRYEKRIDELDESLKHLLTLNFQLLQYENMRKILTGVNEMSKKLLDHGDELPKPSHVVPLNDQENSWYSRTSSHRQPSAPRFRMSYQRSEKITKFGFSF